MATLFWGTTDDLSIFAAGDVSISHHPTIVARAGIAFQDFGRYREAGINIGIGTGYYR